MTIEVDRDDALIELARLRNRHVAKVLTYLGAGTAPYIEQAIKRAMSQFEDDVAVNILESEPKELMHVRQDIQLDVRG